MRYRGFKLNLTGIYNGDEKVQDWAPPSYGKKIIEKKDFTIFNLYTGYRFQKFSYIKEAEVYLKVENLFNRAYEYVKYYPMPERTYYLGVRAKF
ncbi:hypothetical protein THC_0605 [Caldimicrobium thiodismutans]|uniref:Uncharacterized protein n=1 Tax=Caldimicrobium thiodismutans TaxID=1653476 RepID=A0A0U5AG92_9BACT|nr:hypothetical protein THC_0605 [Caldimicrobium thiodismutans]